jgi:hypothetical protein
MVQFGSSYTSESRITGSSYLKSLEELCFVNTQRIGDLMGGYLTFFKCPEHCCYISRNWGFF